jgi:hypothetical protein
MTRRAATRRKEAEASFGAEKAAAGLPHSQKRAVAEVCVTEEKRKSRSEDLPLQNPRKTEMAT